MLVVLQLTGGNDYLNTVIPYNNPLYRDNRKAVGIADNQIMHLDKNYGIPYYMAPMKKFWDEDKLAILHGVGYLRIRRARTSAPWTSGTPASRTRSAPRAGSGRVAREFDPKKENVVTTVSFGPSLFRARWSVPGRAGGLRGRPAGDATASCRHPGQRSALQVLDRFAADVQAGDRQRPVMDYLGTPASTR